MITTEEIRLIPEFTGQTVSNEQSELKLRSGYLVYTNTFGGNLVNEFTVRDFLDNSNNEQLAIDFFNYLQVNYSKSEFNELYYNNLKLSNVLNDYYDKTIRSNLPPTKVVANLQLTATTAVTYTNTNFINYNKRSDELITVVMGYNTGDSYYISVPISKTYSILDNQNYDKYRKDSLGDYISKDVSEQFRYVIRAGVMVNNNAFVNRNFFSDYIPRTPLGLNQPQLKIQFKNDKFIIPQDTQPPLIPIEIVFDKISEFDGQTFQLKISDVHGDLETGFDLSVASTTYIGLVDGQNNNLQSQNILISSGQSAFTAYLSINYAPIFQMTNLNIQLILLAGTNLDYDAHKSSQFYSVSSQEFKIIQQQSEEIGISTNMSVDYVRKKTKINPKYLIQSFVDLNFNDSESQFWLNNPTSNFPEGYSIAQAPVQPPPPAPQMTNLTQITGPVDLTTNFLYNALKNFGYTLSSREGFGQSVVTMDGGNGNVLSKLHSGPSSPGNPPKSVLFHIRGYNLIKYDTKDVGETQRIYNLLRDFFSPFPF